MNDASKQKQLRGLAVPVGQGEQLGEGHCSVETVAGQQEAPYNTHSYDNPFGEVPSNRFRRNSETANIPKENPKSYMFNAELPAH